MKLLLLEERLSKLEDGELVLVMDGYDAIITGTSRQLRAAFLRSGARVLFASDYTFYCPTDRQQQLVESYPEAPTLYRYLTSGAFMGKAGDLHRLVSGVVKMYTDGWS
ncbi:unnamed protein product, partial [Discosporangium mesarthrocarpum]